MTKCPNEFTCEICRKSYHRRNDEKWNEEKKLKEFATLTPEAVGTPVIEVCDICFRKKYLPWLKKTTLNQRIDIINEEINKND